MLTNEDFTLSEEQLKQYDDWVTNVARVHGEDGSIHSIEVKFEFSPFGRSVTATIGPKQLTLE